MRVEVGDRLAQTSDDGGYNHVLAVKTVEELPGWGLGLKEPPTGFANRQLFHRGGS